MNNLIPIVIPSYEPDDKLITLVDKLIESKLKQPVVIVDDGSEGEGYQQIFNKIQKDYPVKVLHHAVNNGKGRALKSAFNYLLIEYPDMIGCVTIDSDGQHRIEDMIACMEALEANPEALVLGVRNFNGENVPTRSSFGNKTTSRVMKLLVGLSISDTQTGLRAIPAQYMKYLMNEKGERFEFETNMLLSTREENIQIIEVPIETIYLEENRTSHFNPLKDSLRIYAMFTKFIVSSLSSSVVDLVLFTIFCSMFRGMEFGAFGYAFIATVAARILSATYNFTINYRTVFKSEGTLLTAILKYALLAIFIMLASGAAVDKLSGLLPVAEVVIKIPVDIILFMVSFIVQREIVYK